MARAWSRGRYRPAIAPADAVVSSRHRRVLRRVALRALAGAIPAAVVVRLAGRPGRWRHAALASIATSAAIEMPTSAPLGIAGLAVAHRHLPADPWASTGGAVGAIATLGVLPRVDDEPARGIAVSMPHDVEPSADGEGLVVVANHGSGGGNGHDVAGSVERALPSSEVVLCDGDGLDAALVSAARRCRALGVVGGDGTVSLAASAALDAGVPLVVFPGGTLNHFARDLGVDTVDGALETVRDGRVVAIDVGTIADRTFVNNASIGSYAALVDERERLESRVGKWPAMLVALVRVLHRSERFEVDIDGTTRSVWMVFFGNCAYEPAGFAPSDRSDLVDGVLDVRLIDATSPWSRLRLIVAVLCGALGRSTVYERWEAASVQVSCAGPGPSRLAADGETFDGPVEFSVGKRPAALLVHAVHPDDAG